MGAAGLSLALAASATGLAIAPPASATAPSFTWTGALSEANWSAANNWEGNSAPSSLEPVALEFPHLSGCETCYETKNDLSGLDVESIQLDNGDEYSLRGDEITLGGGGLTAAPAGGTSGASGDVLALPIHLSAPQTWSVSGRSGGSLGENGAAVVGNLTGSTSALSLEVSNEAVVYLETEAEVGPLTIDGTNASSFGILSGYVPFFGDLNFLDGNPVSLSHIYFIGSGAVGALSTTDAELEVGSGIYPAEGIEADSATFDQASEVSFQITHAGTSAGADYSQLVSTGPVELGNSKLALHVGSTCPTLSPGEQLTLLSTTGTLSGTFGNASQGSEIPVKFAAACNHAPQTIQIGYHESGEPQTVTGTVDATKTRQEEEAANTKKREEGESEAATKKREEEEEKEEEAAATRKRDEEEAGTSVGQGNAPTANNPKEVPVVISAQQRQAEELAAVFKRDQEEEAAAAAQAQEEEAANKDKPRPLTRAQKLAKALKQCKKEPKRKRAPCETRAKKQYGSEPKRHKDGKQT